MVTPLDRQRISRKSAEESAEHDRSEDESGDGHDNRVEESSPLFYGAALQLESLEQCLAEAAADDDKALGSHLMALNLSLIQQDLPRYRFESPILCYCAMMAVSQKHNFNGVLSGMIYCAQIWILRQVCVVVDDDVNVNADEVLLELCQRWLRQERSTTFGIMLNWRLMLFDVAGKEVSSKNSWWKLDESELYHRTLARARTILDRDLLSGADHLPRMTASALHESEYRTEVGWWFALDPCNEPVLRGREQRLVEHINATPSLR
ncbi:hypothetical protein LTR70_010284 [Exophiala xenobiotica]|uniref:Uncharacterized protein n=1 Tax=Lithohypha guttulata TaxID=1690604 RepID=A0ABR0JW71_9EURO|nr:hypothetical protein LTR24_010276 [Lithohypha guttulata]KAK5309442.1 hypothetical protein LTR70_010284 [Exophiala xenobiotica]